MNRMEYSEAGFRLTREFEGLQMSAYQDSVGVWTIGYGHTGADAHRGLQITEDRAMELLRADVETAVRCVCSLVTVPVTQGQFDALVDFCFNLGGHSLRTSTLLKLVNRRDFRGAAGQFALWVHGNGKILPGLARRRAAEAAMFRNEAL